MKIYQITKEAVQYVPPDPEVSAQLKAQGNAVMDADRPKQQAENYIQFSSGLYDPATLPSFMNITDNVKLAVTPGKIGPNMNQSLLANAQSANSKLPRELQLSFDELKNLVGVDDVIRMTGEPNPDNYNPLTDPTNPDPVATPIPVRESDDELLAKMKSIAGL